ncbi:zf-HC2 domain-containing protein [Desulfosarcina ovata]|uniref:Putative zinc-finger domain-containing protein n=1 Tax=Desulfosarcina ovata subsp. ovata TaxID=2752305 RepID=A0A5K8ABT4_9BACT|nr:zf-HC2 domain-containing protein [Desulfosarcina ovata]BBO90122.1 hypothetical protein DSCOOX_33020 [Desulfosarcina ovata subsp. ovata]
MVCGEIRKQLAAWADGELPAREMDRVERHLEECPACRMEARAERQVVAALDALPAVIAPAGFLRRARRAFRAGLVRPGLVQWWQQLNLTMRGAVCGAALAGLLCGAVLGTSLTTLTGDSPATPYQTFYASQGIFP